ncbi:DUF924 family protein [Bordetella genomosp. 1]|uniref:DUF924 domain-containing protein n=1 Tax=Bordetella genomosp. 1 TaxID=1395607 RepID=A0ABX4EWQ0_9BORD|nr:DUF924 family protein [Bordetella genomosp. 1]OZI58900.1 hypothetical protein CAL27_19725 [Bordetella genomosp. 1]
MTHDTPAPAHAVVSFWRDAGPAKWFARDDAFDAAFRARFLDTHFAAARGERSDWEGSAEGVLALLILLDQFPRNAFRGTAHMFATDGLALAIARRAVAAGLDVQVEPLLRHFIYLPFEHAEDIDAQNEGVSLMSGLDADTLRWAIIHRDIIVRFGRFPHRNASLGRTTTEAEQRFLDEGGFAG